MTCPVCGQRKARRDCPALGQSICAVCCGTKRLVEIDCPESCPHLAAARANPAAVVRRQHEADLARLLPTIAQLTERQHQLFFLLQSVIVRHRPEGFARLTDQDVADAAGAVAGTLETAAKGLIYEHATRSPVAHRLTGELKALLQQIEAEGATVYDREAAITLRAIEQGAQTLGSKDDPADSYLALVGRLLQVRPGAPDTGAPTSAGSIILP